MEVYRSSLVNNAVLPPPVLGPTYFLLSVSDLMTVLLCLLNWSPSLVWDAAMEISISWSHSWHCAEGRKVTGQSESAEWSNARELTWLFWLRAMLRWSLDSSGLSSFTVHVIVAKSNLNHHTSQSLPAGARCDSSTSPLRNLPSAVGR